MVDNMCIMKLSKTILIIWGTMMNMQKEEESKVV
jgi:hypothetical protein